MRVVSVFAALLLAAPVSAKPLAVFCPANLTIAAPTGATSAPAVYPAPMTDGGTAPITVVASQASGSDFQAGTTQVSIQVTDSASGSASCSFTVTIAPLAPPPPPPPPSGSATLTASPLAVTGGQSSTLTLITPTGYHNVFINSMRPALVGCSTTCTFTLAVTPTTTTTYQATATNGTGTPYTMPSVTVNVSGANPPPSSTPPSYPTPPGSLPTTLLQATNLVDTGSFTTPGSSVMGSCSSGQVYEFGYANGQIAFNPANQSLFVVGHDWCQHTAEISIPAIGGTATVLQPFIDALYGKMPTITPATGENIKVGGLFVTGSNLLMSAYDYYDGAASATGSHFARSSNLSQSAVIGALTVGTLNPGFIGGYFAAIPSEWQTALGGDLLVGQCCLAVITRSSFGPDGFAVNSADLLAGKNPTAAQPLVYYDQYHTTLGGWLASGPPNPAYNSTTQVHGAVIVPGTASLLYFGSTGLGKACYGVGTSDPSLDGQPVPNDPGVIYCYDPVYGAKGSHGYPYVGYVWAYNLADFAAVKAGTKSPWQVMPYAQWQLPITPIGAAFDPATKRIFLSVPGATLGVHVLQVQ